MNKAFLILTNLGLLLALITGCRFPPPDISLKRRVDEKEVIGTWKLTEATMTLAKRYGYVPAADFPHTIELRTDHTVKFAAITVSPPHKVTPTKADGTWRLEFRDENQLSFNLNGYGMNFAFTETDNGRLILWQFLGDPDDWELIQYEKTVHELRPLEVVVNK